MHLHLPALLLAARRHGETAIIARFLTREHGIIAGYVAGGRGRRIRPVLIPGNALSVEFAARSASQLPFARPELVTSRAASIGEPLPAAAIAWICALTAAALPERQPFAPLYDAVSGLFEAIAHAPAARSWAGALVAYETLLVRELGYGGGGPQPPAHGGRDLAATLEAMDRLAAPLERYLLADRRGDVMAARHRLREMLGRIG